VTRIIGGAAGGRRLVVPSGRKTRPTSDRVREGLFSALGSALDSALGSDLSGRSFLDLYAGSGAVGLEAASRGAAPVVLVERDPLAARTVRENVAALGFSDVVLRTDDVMRFLREPATPYDVVFVDPPYADAVDGVLELLAGGGWVAAGGLVVVEREARGEPPQWPAGIVADRDRRYGDSVLWYGRRP